MADKGAAARAIRKLADQFKPMIIAAEALEAIDNIEKTTQAAEQTMAEANAQALQAVEEMKKAKTALKDAEDLATKARADADKYAEEIRAAANADVAKMGDEAQANATMTIAQARAESDRIRASARQHAGQLEAEVNKRKEELAEVDKQVREKTDELDGINERLEAARKRFAAGLAPV